MTKRFTIFGLLAFFCVSVSAQHKDAIALPTAKFITGTNDDYQKISFNDSQWKPIKAGEVWQTQGYPDYHGYAWYRFHVVIPSSLKNNGNWKDSLRIFLAHVNDVDETFFNEVAIGKTGSFPDDPGGYASKWPSVRTYCLRATNPLIKWDTDNVIAIKVFDGGGSGGIFMGNPFIDMLEKTDGVFLSVPSAEIKYLPNEKAAVLLLISNSFNTIVKGTLKYAVFNAIDKKEIIARQEEILFQPFDKKIFQLNVPDKPGIEISYTFTGQGENASIPITGKKTIPYILTPAES